MGEGSWGAVRGRRINARLLSPDYSKGMFKGLPTLLWHEHVKNSV